jgi:hypothetical protein
LAQKASPHWNYWLLLSAQYETSSVRLHPAKSPRVTKISVYSWFVWKSYFHHGTHTSRALFFFRVFLRHSLLLDESLLSWLELALKQAYKFCLDLLKETTV